MTTSTAPIWELADSERPVEGLDASGAPDPTYAAALGLISAPLGRRAAAAAIDIGVYLLLQVPLLIFSLPLFRRLLTGRISWYGFVNHPDFLVAVIIAGVTLLLTILFLVGQLVISARWGFTIGKLATGLRSVNVSTLAKPGFLRSAARALVAWLPVVTVVGTPVVLASPLWSQEDRRRGWHDRAGRVWVVDSRRGLDPYDAKRMRVARKTVTSTPAPRSKDLPSLATSAGSNLYRPGTRTSAGVLGVARPHTGDGREVVGLTGLVPGAAPPPAPETTGVPQLGAYVQQNPVAPASPAMPGTPVAPAPVVPAAPAGASAGAPAGAPVGAPGSEPAAPPVEPHPGTASPSAPAEPAPAHRAHAAPTALLVLDTGEQVRVDGPVVLGRSPVPVGGARPLAISDPDFSISKSHVVLRPTATGFEVIDQGSTNGTALVHDGQEIPLAAGEVGLAIFGDTIRIGDRTARVLAS